jgi:hypothetical protein
MATNYVFNGGIPYDPVTGGMIRQLNQTPAPTDPYVVGIRVGPLGGVYMISDSSGTPPEIITSPVIYAPVNVGSPATHSEGAATGSPLPSIILTTWKVDGIVVQSGPPTPYTPILADYGKELTVEETWENTAGNVVASSAPVTVTNDFPQMEFDFLSGTLDPLITFSRITVGTYFDAAGVMQTAAIGEARFDHDPFTHAPRGLMVEALRTNLFLNNSAPVSQGITVTAQAYTLSFYGEGSITLSGAHSATLNGTGVYPSRAVLTFTPTAGTLTLTVVNTSMSLAQLEAGGCVSSAIATAGASVQRAPDNVNVTGTNFSSWYNQAAGAYLFDGDVISANANAYLCVINDSTTSNRWAGYFTNVSQINGLVNVAGVASNIPLTPVVPVSLKYAITIEAGRAANSANGSAPNASAPAAAPVCTQLNIGNGLNGSYMMGWVRSWSYWATPKTNAELQEITGA